MIDKEPSPSLKKFDLTELEPIIQESEGAFLPYSKRPDSQTRDLFERFTEDPEFAAYGYERQGSAATIIVALSHQGGDTIAIGPMYVALNQRRRGLGTSQVEDFIETYSAAGKSTIHTKTWESNYASRTIFDNLGFKIVEVKENDRVNGEATLAYQRDI